MHGYVLGFRGFGSPAVLGGSERQIMNPTPKCLRCGAEMEEGFIWAFSFGTDNALRWIAGSPSSGFFGSKVHDKDVRKVATFRCPKCGSLESYAPNSPT